MDLQRALRRFRQIGGPVLVGLGALLLAFPLGSGPDDADLDDEVLYYASSMFQGYAAILAVFLILMIFGIERMHGQEKEKREELHKKYQDNYAKIIEPALKDIDSDPNKQFNAGSVKDWVENTGISIEDYNRAQKDIQEYQSWKRREKTALDFIIFEGKFLMAVSAAVIVLSLAGFISSFDNVTMLALFTIGVLYSLTHIVLWLYSVISVLKEYSGPMYSN